MSEVTINENTLSNIASAIRNKLGVETTYKPNQMASAISSIETPKLEQRTFTSNGEYLPNYGKNGMSKVIVDVVPSYSAADEGKVVSSGALIPQTSISVSQNGSYDTTLNNQIIVDVVPSLESISISQNGTFTPSVDGFSEVVVDVQPSLGSISISENGTYTPSDVDGFNQVIVSVAGGGAGSEATIIEGTFSELDNSQATKVRKYFCYYNATVRTVSLPNVSIIEGSAFYSCFNLSQVYMPQCESIGTQAFYYCPYLQEANFPACLTVGSYAFYSNSRLTEASFPACLSLGSSAFISCSSLSVAYFPECVQVSQSAFYSCSKLVEVNFEKCKSVGAYAFYNCSKLAQIRLTDCSTIASGAFNGCSKLESVYMLASSVTNLVKSGAFGTTPMTNSTYVGHYGSIYVPSSLYNDYIVASNWSYFADRITSYIEE